MIKKFNLFFLTLFNVGKIKYASGTIASAITCLIFLILINFLDISIILFLVLIILFYSFIAINNSYESFESNDPKEIVIDEFIGQMFPLIFLPIYETLYLAPKFYYCVAAFILFRIFDIWKPYPINYVDNNTGGALGIILDDILAGVYTMITLTVLFFFLGA